MERAYLLAGLMALAGLPLLWLALKQLGRALHFRLAAGKPYVPGSIARSLVNTGLVLTLLVIASGLAGARWGMRDFQQVDGTHQAARIRVEQGPSPVLYLEGAEGYPGRPVMVVGLQGESWQVGGLLITFPRWTAVLGLGAFHRIMAVGSPGAADRQQPEGVDDARWLIAGMPSFVPVQSARVAVAGSGAVAPWQRLMVNRDGYMLGGRE